MNNKLGYIHQIRDQKYYIEILMYNQIDGEKPLSVPFFFVDSLMIEESLQNWPTSGYIVLNTSFEIFSRGNSTEFFTENSSVKKIKAPYIDRTDGRNKIAIKILPLASENDKVQEKNSLFPKDKWEMSFDFVITDIQDLPTPNAQVKKRKYIFIDERYQILKERNLEWSSANLSVKINNTNKKPYELTDSEKSINPNELLKEVIKLAGTNPNPNFNANDILYVGFKEGENIDTPSIPFANFDDNTWDSGHPNNKIPYHTSASFSALDDMYSILPYCVASDGGPVILDFGRTTDDKKWHLIPVLKYFEDASGKQIERLILEASSGFDEKNKPHVSRGPTDTGDVMSPIASRIQKYYFSPMVAADDNRITNSAISYYDHSTGSFHIKVKNNTADSVIQTLEKYANSGLYSFKKGRNAQILLNLNKTKQSGLMFETKQSYNGSFVYEDIKRNEMILDSIFLNQSICFQAYGLTIRSPGRFIFIDRMDFDSNPFDDRFFGQWLITKVGHLFTQETYVTEVVAVKIDSFDKVWNKKDTNF